MQLSHTLRAGSAVFDDPNLVSAAGLVPVLKLADRAGLRRLADQHLSVPTDKGCERRVEGCLFGRGDGRWGGQHRRYGGVAAWRDGSDLQPGLCTVDVGVVPADVHLWPRPPARRGRLPVPDRLGRCRPTPAGTSDELVLVDVDDTIIAGPRLRQAGLRLRILRDPRPERPARHCYHSTAAPIIVAQRLRKGACGSPRGAGRLVADALKTVKTGHRGQSSRCCGPTRRSTATPPCPPPSRPARMCRSRSASTRGSRRPSQHPRRRVADHRLHRRHLRRGDSAVDFPG